MMMFVSFVWHLCNHYCVEYAVKNLIIGFMFRIVEHNFIKLIMYPLEVTPFNVVVGQELKIETNDQIQLLNYRHIPAISRRIIEKHACAFLNSCKYLVYRLICVSVLDTHGE